LTQITDSEQASGVPADRLFLRCLISASSQRSLIDRAWLMQSLERMYFRGSSSTGQSLSDSTKSALYKALLSLFEQDDGDLANNVRSNLCCELGDWATDKDEKKYWYDQAIAFDRATDYEELRLVDFPATSMAWRLSQNVGDWYDDNGLYDQAHEQYRTYVRFCEEHQPYAKTPSNLLSAYERIVEGHALGHFQDDNAEAYSAESVRLAENWHSLGMNAEAAKSLAIAYRAAARFAKSHGDTDTAVQYLEKCLDVLANEVGPNRTYDPPTLSREFRRLLGMLEQWGTRDTLIRHFSQFEKVELGFFRESKDPDIVGKLAAIAETLHLLSAALQHWRYYHRVCLDAGIEFDDGCGRFLQEFQEQS